MLEKVVAGMAAAMTQEEDGKDIEPNQTGSITLKNVFVLVGHYPRLAVPYDFSLSFGHDYTIVRPI